MENIDFYYTADNSVGMYDKNTKDIFHSVTGALQESYDKFIFPTQFEEFCKTHSCVRVLDICFGIGYNTKSAIYFAKKNNKNIKIKIDALELCEETASISPFICDEIKQPEINIFLLASLQSQISEYLVKINNFLIKEEEIISKFFSPPMTSLYKRFYDNGYTNTHPSDLYSYLHNIYYQNVSMSMENDLISNNIQNISFSIKIGDARQTIKTLTEKYDFIFLDAFTPHKQPLLWTKDFLSILTSLLNSSGIISTYSNSTPVRKTLSDLGLNVGKIILNEKQFGTVASYDKSKIIHPLDEYDIGLMNTKSGIPYRDNNLLNLSSKEILQNREKELKTCDKMSTTEYKKRYSNGV